MKITKKDTKEYIKLQLSTKDKWVIQALLKIYEFQTADEVEHEYTYNQNSVGFTGVDGKILTSFAKFYLRKGYLSPAQMTILRKKMPKYWKQIIANSNTAQLNTLVVKYKLTKSEENA